MSPNSRQRLLVRATAWFRCQIYGQVNKALLIWDDGIDSDAYIVDHDFSSSRFGMTGKATMAPGWTAGFLMEFDVQGLCH